MRILVSNDDSYLSPGLYILYDSIKDLHEALVISTQYPKSATGREITFNKPLRLFKTRYMGYEVYVTDGTPIDALHLAIDVLGFEPDIVLSGVNVGENLSLQHIYYSGTVGLAIEAALMGIPAIAISADVQEFSDFNDDMLQKEIAKLVRGVLRVVDTYGFPKGVDILTINVPRMSNFKNCYRVVKAARLRWRARYKMDRDVRGNICYWLQGEFETLNTNTDVHVFERESCITISPLNVDLNVSESLLGTVRKLIEDSINERQ